MTRGTKTVRQAYCLSDLALLAGVLAIWLLFSLVFKNLPGLGYTLLLCWAMMFQPSVELPPCR